MSKKEVKGCCPLDCQDGCAWVAHVEDGTVTRVVGAKEHPFTRGILCAKVNDYQTRTYAADRLLFPMRRSAAKGSGKFERISWDEALGEIADSFESIITSHGAEALLPLHDMGSAGVLQRRALMRLFHALGASRIHGSLCGQAGNAVAAEGHLLGFDPETIAESELILLWGSNLLSTAHHHWHFCAEARKSRGAKIIAIDPRRTRTAMKCDEHIQIRTGTDAVLAAGIANLIVQDGKADFDYARAAAVDVDAYLEEIAPWTPDRVEEVTGVADEDLRRLAGLFGGARPATIRAGIGPQQTRDGELFLRGVSALAILSGHWRLSGGGLFIESYPTLDNTAPEGPELSPPGTRSLDRARIGDILNSSDLAPPVKGLMVWGHNTLVNQIDAESVRKGFSRDDLFTVVIEHFMTDTARYADIILPSTTQLEHFDIQGSWGQHYVGLNRPAIAPLGEAKPHAEIMRLLASKLKPDEPALFLDDEAIARSSLPVGFDWEKLYAQGWLKASPPARHPASDGPRLTLCCGLAAPDAFRAAEPMETGKLRLLTAKAHYFINSTFANMPRQRKQQGHPTLEMHPNDAERHGLADGAEVKVGNERGELPAVLRIADSIVEGTVVFEGKWWSDGQWERAPITNRLAAPKWTGGGQPRYNDIAVEVTPAEEK